MVVVRHDSRLVFDRVLGLEIAHGAKGDARDDDADDRGMYGDGNLQSLRESAKGGADHRAEAEEGVEDRHDVASKHAFIGRPGDVHCDVTDAEGCAENGQADEDHREARPEVDAQPGKDEADRANREAPGDGGSGTEARDDVTGCEEPGDRAGGDAQDQEPHL